MTMMIGERLREARLSRRLSLGDVAGKANISASTLSRIENNKQGLEIGLFLEIARVLEADPGGMLGDPASGDTDVLVDQITSLEPRDRAALWRDLSELRRAARSRNRPLHTASLGQQLDELLAQIDFLREEIEAVRADVKRRKRK